MPLGSDAEFGFELRVCAWAERHWPPGAASRRPVLVGRQLGTDRRRWDTVVLEVDPVGLAERATFGSAHLDSDLLHVVRHAPPDWEFYRDALPEPEYPWRYVREAVHEAADRGAVESKKRGGRIEIRRVAPYPDWFDRLVAIENKPDLDASAARDLQDQLERDVASKLADEVWLATEATGDPVEPAFLERIPPEVGILSLDRDGVEVLWHPRTLAVDRRGTRIVERAEDSTYGSAAARFEYLSAAEKRRRRLVIAERAYERGWRSYRHQMRTDCRHFMLRPATYGFVPYCRAKEREQTAAECSERCHAFEPEPPRWREHGWPLEGGPGQTVTRMLERRRDDARTRAKDTR
ncbi:MAG: DUF5787 family protein [Halodesulfurarchaeum sp.]